jgi:hypothetical protein
MRTNFICSEHIGQAGGILMLGIAAPYLRRKHTGLSATGAWHRDAVGDSSDMSPFKDRVEHQKTWCGEQPGPLLSLVGGRLRLLRLLGNLLSRLWGWLGCPTRPI